MPDVAMFCPTCHKQVHPHAMICQHCGSEIPASGPILASDQGPSLNNYQLDSTNNSFSSSSQNNNNSDHIANKTYDNENENILKVDSKTESQVSYVSNVSISSGSSNKSAYERAILWRHIAELESQLSWTEIWFFLMWGFLFLTFFIN